MQDDLTAELKKATWGDDGPSCTLTQLEKNKFVAKKALNELMAHS